MKNNDSAKDGYGAHTGGSATCTEKAVCEVCSRAYGELDANNHADLRHIEAKAPEAVSRIFSSVLALC